MSLAKPATWHGHTVPCGGQLGLVGSSWFGLARCGRATWRLAWLGRVFVVRPCSVRSIPRDFRVTLFRGFSFPPWRSFLLNVVYLSVSSMKFLKMPKDAV